MAKKVPVPTITYKQARNPNPAALDAVFDHLFELLLKSKGKEKTFTSKR